MSTDNIIERFKHGEAEENIRIMASSVFSKEVLDLMKTDDISAIDALTAVCDNHQIDEEDVMSLLTPKLINVIQKDSEDRHLLKKPTNSPRLF